MSGSDLPGVEVEKRVSALDGTVKLLFRFGDGAPAESVVMFHKGRASVCLSSQSGCACGCVFCATGALGLRRDLSAGEIVAQFAACREAAGGAAHSIVFMGMGEPFLNWENVRGAIAALSDQKSWNIPQSRMTVSTVGVVPGIEALAASDLKVNLAVSVVTADEGLRGRLVPMSARYPLGEVMAAARRCGERRRRTVFLEYILFGGLNDSLADAAGLAALARGMDCTVNLIRYNSAAGSGLAAPDQATAKDFQKALMAAGVRAYMRRETGSDIAAACGQLAGGGPVRGQRE